MLIKSFEGFRPRAIRREDGRWMIGYGHTLSAREGAGVSEADAELLLQYDLLPVAGALNDSVVSPLNQHQFDALASFAFSVGLDRFQSSNVLQRLNAGAAGEAADAMVGWPEPALPETALRRRAAERALFVADPALPVALSDLLSAPLPPPPVAPASENAATEEPEAELDPVPVVETISAARAAAMASLLGETTPRSTAETPVEIPVFTAPAPEPADIDVEAAVEAGDDAGLPPPAGEPDPIASVPESDPGNAPHLAVVMTMQRYAPYSTAIVGPLPGAGSPTAPAASEDEGVVEAVASTLTAATEPQGGGGELLVLTPLAEDDIVPAPRPIWQQQDRQAPTADLGQTALFEEESGLGQSLGHVLRHETMAEPPQRFDWEETGAFLIMGAVGLVSFGMSMAAFRRASQLSDGTDGLALIGWVLAIVGASCVGVSSYNLYRRWGRSSE